MPRGRATKRWDTIPSARIMNGSTPLPKICPYSLIRTRYVGTGPYPQRLTLNELWLEIPHTSPRAWWSSWRQPYSSDLHAAGAVVPIRTRCQSASQNFISALAMPPSASAPGIPRDTRRPAPTSTAVYCRRCRLTALSNVVGALRFGAPRTQPGAPRWDRPAIGVVGSAELPAQSGFFVPAHEAGHCDPEH